MTAHNRLKLEGRRFGRLVVLRFDKIHRFPSGLGKSRWMCKCNCGKEISVLGSSLTSGNTTSCGCANVDAIRERNFKHGKTGTRTYLVWQAMLNRCRNPNVTMFYRYGGRGISVCERWIDFENFLSDMGECPPRMSIERIDNDGNYEPQNCRWADRRTQARNTSSNRVIRFGGREMCLKAWADELQMDQASLSERIKRWGLDRALTQPKMRENRGIA